MLAGVTGAEELFYLTTSLCPTCDRLLPGRVIGRADGVFVVRSCPEHGGFEGLLCSDLEWFRGLARFDVEPVKPAHPKREVEQGCPLDCGLCTAHRQIAGTAAIEISNRCNADCPVCLADNQTTFELTVEQVRASLDSLIAAQGHVDAVALSGGEPTIHPKIFEILREVASRPEVGRVALNSNGLRIARDDAFLDELAKQEKVYVSIHYDGKRAKELRGIDHALQCLALERLAQWKIPAAPVVLAATGVNDDELGELLRDLLRKPNVTSVMVSMMTHAGGNGARFPGDPAKRLTIAGALDRIDSWSASSSGSPAAIFKRDFMPLPMPNPVCAAIGYFLVDGGDVTGLIPLGDLDEIIEATKNTNFVRDDAELERMLRDVIDRLYASPERFADAPALSRRLRALLDRLFPTNAPPCCAAERRAIVEAHVKTVYLFQFMDAWTFDSKRLQKCSCQHLMPDGSTIPSCSYYAYHRKRDPRFAPVEATAGGEQGALVQLGGKPS